MTSGIALPEHRREALHREVVQFTQELIRIDTSNFGDNSGPGEKLAADYVCQRLAEVGLSPQRFESSPGRVSVAVRVPGRDPGAPALCVHGHLDVVPAKAEDWSVDPFGGQLIDGVIYGRGAVDMKGMDAMILAVVRDLIRHETPPARELLVIFFADEEAAGTYGSQWLVEHHPELFAGVTEAISEVGGYSVSIPTPAQGQQRAYLLQTAEKGLAWLTLTANGTAGHGSTVHRDNAVSHLARAIAAIADHDWPLTYIASVRGLLDAVGEASGTSWTPERPEPVIDHLGSVAGFVRGTLANTSNVTMLEAGYKHNVIPQQARAKVDARFLPGQEEELLTTIRKLAGPQVQVTIDHLQPALEAPESGPLVDAMTRAILSEDPDGVVVPYCLSGGTDNKALSRLGIVGYGFAPLQLPPDLDFGGLFHGVDERVPVSSLEFGVRTLWRFIQDC